MVLMGELAAGGGGGAGRVAGGREGRQGRLVEGEQVSRRRP